MAKFFVTTMIATALILGSVGLFMLPVPQEGAALKIWQPQQSAGLIVTLYPTFFPINRLSVERVGFIMKPSPNRAGLIMR